MWHSCCLAAFVPYAEFNHHCQLSLCFAPLAIQVMRPPSPGIGESWMSAHERQGLRSWPLVERGTPIGLATPLATCKTEPVTHVCPAGRFAPLMGDASCQQW